MRIHIEHRTHYRYATELVHSAQYLRLTPYSNPSQRIINWRVDAPGQLTQWMDAFGNTCHTLVMERPATEIEIVAAGRIDTADAAGVLPERENDLPIEVFLRPTPLTRANARVRDFAEDFRARMDADRIKGLHALMGGVREKVDYKEGATHVATTAADVLAAGAGVCQDHAHVFIACCRALGVPARYVSGYLHAGDDTDEFTASHAWAAAWVSELGWVSFDVANTVCGTDRHVGVAVALDYAGAGPVRGVRHGGDELEDLSVSVRVSTAQQ
jgi:transglutaminase-like putative cysteine protease